jgi:hypothetical protein
VLLFSDFKKTLNFSQQILENLNIKYHKNPYCVNIVFPCGQTEGQMDMTKHIVAFPHFAKAPNKVKKLERQAANLRTVSK